MDLFQIWPSIETDDFHPQCQRRCLPGMDECFCPTKYSVSPRTSHWVVAPALSTGYGGYGHGYGGRAGHSQQQVPTLALALLAISSKCMLEARSLAVANSAASWILLLLLLLLLRPHRKWRGKKTMLHSPFAFPCSLLLRLSCFNNSILSCFLGCRHLIFAFIPLLHRSVGRSINRNIQRSLAR